MKRIFLYLGKLKNTPAVWNLWAPLLLAVAVKASHGWHLLLPIAAYALAEWVVPENEAPEAQRIHFLLAYSAIAALGWKAALVVIPAAFVIEYVFDPRYEPDPWKPGGEWDFGAYCAGTVTALLTLLV